MGTLACTLRIHSWTRLLNLVTCVLLGALQKIGHVGRGHDIIKTRSWRDSAANCKWCIPHLAVFTFFWYTLGCSSAMKLHNVLSLFLSGGHKTQLTAQQQGKSLHIFIEGLPSNLLAWSLVIIFCGVLEVDSFLYWTQLCSVAESVEFKSETMVWYHTTLKDFAK